MPLIIIALNDQLVIAKINTTYLPKLVAALLGVAGVTAGLAKSNGSLAGLMTHITSRLTAKNRDQLRDPTLCNRVWATFTFLLTYLVPICSANRLTTCRVSAQQ